MSRVNEILEQLDHISQNPKEQLDKFIEEGKKVIGVFPYYVPEELVVACGMVPMGVWGGAKEINKAKEYFASYYCTIAQMNLELGLNGTLDRLSGVIVTTMCDTLRPLSQNFRVGVPQIPFIYLAHPQNRKKEFGIKYSEQVFTRVLNELEEISGKKATEEDLLKAFEIYNANRQEKRRFSKLAALHPEVISATLRSAVFKSSYFMEKEEHTALLKELNNELEKLEVVEWTGTKVMTSGILCDSKKLLKIFDDNKVAIVADDVAHESRTIKVDIDMEIAKKNPMEGLATWFANCDDDVLLYDPTIYSRPRNVAKLAKESGADGAVIVMMQFCDPEEVEYPHLKEALDNESIPSIKLGYDQQMVDFGQAETQIQAFTDVMSL